MAANKPVLGQQTEYPDRYDPSLLVAIPRAEGRRSLTLPDRFFGVDQWTAYELSWLTESGKPVAAIAEFSVGCHSANIVESKSFKLYLNSYNQHRFQSREAVEELLVADLSGAFGESVSVSLFEPEEYGRRGLAEFSGICLDGLDVSCDRYTPNPGLLEIESESPVAEQLYSHLLKTNCPVTGQPDWATVAIDYRGPKIRRDGLLRYLVSYRQHQDFHENCVETLFCDIFHRCAPEELTVYARYTRRGGLDINPFRSTREMRPAYCRPARQ